MSANGNMSPIGVGAPCSGAMLVSRGGVPRRAHPARAKSMKPRSMSV
jgi:hypothetical protein